MLFQFSASLVQLCIYGVYLRLKTPFDEFDRHQPFLGCLTTISAILVIITEFLLPFVAYEIKITFESYSPGAEQVEGSFFWIASILLITVPFQIFINRKMRLLGEWLFLLSLFFIDNTPYI